MLNQLGCISHNILQRAEFYHFLYLHSNCWDQTTQSKLSYHLKKSLNTFLYSNSLCLTAVFECSDVFWSVWGHLESNTQ